ATAVFAETYSVTVSASEGTTGKALLISLIVVLTIATIGGGYWYVHTRKASGKPLLDTSRFSGCVPGLTSCLRPSVSRGSSKAKHGVPRLFTSDVTLARDKQGPTPIHGVRVTVEPHAGKRDTPTLRPALRHILVPCTVAEGDTVAEAAFTDTLSCLHALSSRVTPMPSPAARHSLAPIIGHLPRGFLNSTRAKASDHFPPSPGPSGTLTEACINACDTVVPPFEGVVAATVFAVPVACVPLPTYLESNPPSDVCVYVVQSMLSAVHAAVKAGLSLKTLDSAMVYVHPRVGDVYLVPCCVASSKTEQGPTRALPRVSRVGGYSGTASLASALSRTLMQVAPSEMRDVAAMLREREREGTPLLETLTRCLDIVTARCRSLPTCAHRVVDPASASSHSPLVLPLSEAEGWSKVCRLAAPGAPDTYTAPMRHQFTRASLLPTTGGTLAAYLRAGSEFTPGAGMTEESTAVVRHLLARQAAPALGGVEGVEGERERETPLTGRTVLYMGTSDACCQFQPDAATGVVALTLK
ncbi:hypothetical protein KIPB_010675, partial [Kipferlia bialata]